MPSKVEELPGIVIDIPNSELGMSCEKQSEILHELERMSYVKVVTKKKLLSLIVSCHLLLRSSGQDIHSSDVSLIWQNQLSISIIK